MNIDITAQELKNVVGAGVNYRDEAKFEFREKGILIRIQDESNTALYNCLIPKSVLSTYDVDREAIGVKIEDMNDIIDGTDETINLRFNGKQIEVSQGGRVYKTPAIAPDEVRGVPDAVPSGLGLPVKIKADPRWILEFIQDAHQYVFNGNEGSAFWMSANEGVMVLWSRRDDYELTETFHWEDFADYEINWDGATRDKNQTMAINPENTNRIEVLLSIPLTKDMKFFADEVVVEFGHGMPLKAVSETEEGVKHSWIVPPRFPRDTSVTQVPDEVIEDRGLEV